MKKKKKIANGIMVAIIVVIAAAGVLLTGKHLGWFDRVEDVQAVANVTRNKGIVDLTRDGIASHLEDVTALRDGDQLSGNKGAQATVQFGEGYLILGEDAVISIDRAAVDEFAVTVLSGEVFLCAKDTAAVTVGEQSFSAKDATVALSARTGSESVGVLSGKVTIGEKELAAGQLASFSTGSEPAYTVLKATALSDFMIQCAQGAADKLCFTADELAKVLTDRQAQKSDTKDKKDDKKDSKTDPDKEDNSSAAQTGNDTDSGKSGSKTDKTDKTDPTTAKPEKKPTSEPDNKKKKDEEKPAALTCTIQIRCDTILDNMDNLEAGKDAYVPSSGTILSSTTVSFTEGETVFDVLKRVCDQYGIQLEYSYTPAYESYYIEGINYLYEFDCGSESGWMYKVNGWFPNYGCSEYTLEQGDSIVWCYTCNGLGADVGGGVG